MKNIAFLILFLVGWGLGDIRATPIKSELWFNEFSGKYIEVIRYSNGMKIKGLPYMPGFIWFKRSSKTTFYNSRRDRVIFSQGRIIYSDRKRSGKLTYVPVKPEATKIFMAELESINQNNINKSQVPLNTITNLEGTWDVSNIDKKVYIVNTRDGIRARFTDDLNWTNYTYDAMTLRYLSQAGHYYYLENDVLIWSDAQNSRKFYMHKISTDLIK